MKDFIKQAWVFMKLGIPWLLVILTLLAVVVWFCVAFVHPHILIGLWAFIMFFGMSIIVGGCIELGRSHND